MAFNGKRLVPAGQGWNPWDYSHRSKDSWDSKSQVERTPKHSKSLRQVCSDFADDTSLNGIVFLKHATNKWTRIFWILFLMIMTCMVFYQLIGVFQMFLNKGFNTVVELKNAPDLAFPSVTICNVNPMKNSLAAKMSQEMRDFLKNADDRLPTGVEKKQSVPPVPPDPAPQGPPGPASKEEGSKEPFGPEQQEGSKEPSGPEQHEEGSKEPSGPEQQEEGSKEPSGPEQQEEGSKGPSGPKPHVEGSQGLQRRSTQAPHISTPVDDNYSGTSASSIITNGTLGETDNSPYGPKPQSSPPAEPSSPPTEEPVELETITSQMNNDYSITTTEDPSTQVFSSFSATTAKNVNPSEASTLDKKPSTTVRTLPPKDIKPVVPPRPKPLVEYSSTTSHSSLETTQIRIEESTTRKAASTPGASSDTGPRGPISEGSKDPGKGKDSGGGRVKRQTMDPPPKAPLPPPDPFKDLDKDYEEYYENKKDSFFATSELSDRYQTYTEFLQLYGDMEIEARKETGVQIEDMLIDCSYGGSKCSAMNFTHHASPKYGNCYTFNGYSDTNKSPIRIFHSGKIFGLELSLFVDVYDYIPGVTDGYGAVVVIHPFDTLPIHEQSGLMVSPGFETDFAIKLVNISRLGKPYNSCSMNGNFTELFQSTYTNEACINTCIYITIVETCGCYKAPFESYLPIGWLDKFPKCSTNTSLACAQKTETLCALGILGKSCQCEAACSEQVFEVTSTNIAWPHRSLHTKVANALCEMSDDNCENIACSKDEIDSGKCEPSNVNAKDLSEALKENVLKLKIYYAELNYQQLYQTPDYSISSFGADIGGTIGLWLGFSVVTGMEIIQFVMKLCYRCFRNTRYKCYAH